jgi:hypothetical protein
MIFNNFVLRSDWKVSNGDDNSGVLVRLLNLGNDPKVAIMKGISSGELV